MFTDTYEYDAFGNKINSTGSTPNLYKYRGEQYDPDLGLYYLRARYYNPLTARFMSRDPQDGVPVIPATLHRYLYAGADPVNHIDPRGRFLAEYAVQSADAVPEAKLVSIYGCVADASLAATDLLLDKEIGGSTALSVGSTVIGCVLLTPGIGALAEEGSQVAKGATKTLEYIGYAAGFGSCAMDAKEFVEALDGLASGSPNQEDISKSIEALGGCVGDALGYMLTHPGKALQGLH